MVDEATLALASEGLLFLLVGGMAGSCDASLLRSKFTTFNGYKGIGAGLLCQFVLLPLLGFLALTAFPQSPATAISLLVVTSSPGGGFSGFWCFLSNADLALSVAMTTASTWASVIALPLNLLLYVTLLYGRDVDVGMSKLLRACAVVVAAVFSGYTLSKSIPQSRQAVSLFGQAAGVALMALGAFANTSSGDPVWTNPPGWFAAVSLPVLGGLSLAMLLARSLQLPNPEAVAVAIECCYQNTGLALTIALSALPPDGIGEGSGVPLFYGIIEIIVIPVFALAAWRCGWTYAPITDNVCKVLFGNYQPEKGQDSSASEGSRRLV